MLSAVHDKIGQRQDLRVVQWKPPNPATCFSDFKGNNVHTIQDLDFADTEHAPKYLRSSPVDDVHARTPPRLTFCQSPSTEVSMDGLIDPQLLEFDISQKGSDLYTNHFQEDTPMGSKTAALLKFPQRRS